MKIVTVPTTPQLPSEVDDVVKFVTFCKLTLAQSNINYVIFYPNTAIFVSALVQSLGLTNVFLVPKIRVYS